MFLGGLNENDDSCSVFYPGVGQTNISPTRYPISVGFYPSCQISSINISRFKLFDNNGVEIATSRTTYDGSEYVKEVVFTPNNNLMPNHRYRVEASVSAGVKTFEKTWYFTTGSN